MKKFILIAAALILSGCGSLDKAKECSKAITENGFKILGYQGYERKFIVGPWAWYTASRQGVTYQMAVATRGDECHIYNLESLDKVSREEL